jgi:hypothetical protein
MSEETPFLKDTGKKLAPASAGAEGPWPQPALSFRGGDDGQPVNSEALDVFGYHCQTEVPSPVHDLPGWPLARDKPYP